MCEKCELNQNINFLNFGIGLLSAISFLLFIFGFIDITTKGETFFVCASVLVPAIAILYQIKRNNKEDKQKESKFYLERYREVSDMILDRLKSDKPSLRSNWTTAGNMAKEHTLLLEKVTEPSDKAILKIYQRALAHEIFEFILDKKARYFAGKGNNSDELSKSDFEKVSTSSAGGSNHSSEFEYIPSIVIQNVLQVVNEIWSEEINHKINTYEKLMNVLRGRCPELHHYLSCLQKWVEKK